MQLADFQSQINSQPRRVFNANFVSAPPRASAYDYYKSLESRPIQRLDNQNHTFKNAISNFLFHAIPVSLLTAAAWAILNF